MGFLWSKSIVPVIILFGKDIVKLENDFVEIRDFDVIRVLKFHDEIEDDCKEILSVIKSDKSSVAIYYYCDTILGIEKNGMMSPTSKISPTSHGWILSDF